MPLAPPACGRCPRAAPARWVSGIPHQSAETPQRPPFQQLASASGRGRNPHHRATWRDATAPLPSNARA
eukprot:1862190-Alexandrium_andersonii.AAC.1